LRNERYEISEMLGKVFDSVGGLVGVVCVCVCVCARARACANSQL
jgi:hypothetical protein